GAQIDDLLHDAEDRVSDALGLLFQAREIDVLDPALPHDLARGLLRDDAEAGLCTGERSLDLEAITGPPFVGKNPPHLRRRKDVAEDGGIERSRGHAFSPIAPDLLEHIPVGSIEHCVFGSVTAGLDPTVHSASQGFFAKRSTAPQLGLVRVTLYLCCSRLTRPGGSSQTMTRHQFAACARVETQPLISCDLASPRASIPMREHLLDMQDARGFC